MSETVFATGSTHAPGEVRRFPCKQCGAHLEFAPGQKTLTCPYCGYKEEIPQTAEQIQEYDLLEALRNMPRTEGWGATRSALPCAKDRRGTYTCVIKYSGGFKRVYWNPNKRVRITTVKSATQLVRGDGTTSRIKGGSKQYVGFLPVMVRSRA